MALITCVECGNEFSDRAAACPKCGCPTYESIETAERPPEASARPQRRTSYEQAAPATAKKPNGCATGCGALLLGLLVLGFIGSMVGDGDNSPTSSTPRKPDPFGEIEAKVYCRDLIKKQLRDPDSYKFEQAVILSRNGQYGTARVFFRSKNGFGGYVRSSAKCTAYDKNGDRWFRAVIEGS